MLILAIVFCAGTFGFNFQMTTALMATEVFGKGAGEYGLLGSILAVGSLGGSLIAARRRRPRQAVIVGVADRVRRRRDPLRAWRRRYLLFALSQPLCGITSLLMIATANAFVQMSVSADMRGRVMALYMCIFMGGTPLGAPILGWVAEQWGARWTLIGGGALTLIGTIGSTVLLAGRRACGSPPTCGRGRVCRSATARRRPSPRPSSPPDLGLLVRSASATSLAAHRLGVLLDLLDS